MPPVKHAVTTTELWGHSRLILKGTCLKQPAGGIECSFLVGKRCLHILFIVYLYMQAYIFIIYKYICLHIYLSTNTGQINYDLFLREDA